jgi:hypothetical protein
VVPAGGGVAPLITASPMRTVQPVEAAVESTDVPEADEAPCAPGAETETPPVLAGALPDLAVIRHRWTELKEAIAAQAPTDVAVALEMARVVKVERGELFLAFTHDLFHSSIEKEECRTVFQAVTAQYLGIALLPRCVVGDVLQPVLPDDAFLQQACELFGATGVESVAGSDEGEQRP